MIIASVSRETVFERYRFGLDYILNSLPGSSTAGVPNQLRDIELVYKSLSTTSPRRELRKRSGKLMRGNNFSSHVPSAFTVS